jgi:ABC-type sugar transport system permease subunit
MSTTSSRGRPYLFAGPLLVVFTLFYLWPATSTVVSSLFRWGLLNPWSLVEPDEWRFVGIGNYIEVLTSQAFWNASLNTVLWLVAFPVLVTVLGLLISLLIYDAPAGSGVLRNVFIVPMTISLAAAGVIWSLMYNPDFGVVPVFLNATNLAFAVDWGPIHFQTAGWLSDPGFIDLGVVQLKLVNLSLVIPAAWAFTGFGVITFSAGLASLGTDLLEAARVDGANWFQRVRYVMVPSLRGSMVIVLVVSVIFALRTFDIVWVMTKGGPGTDSEVIAVRLWKLAFEFLERPQAGSGVAIAVLMSAVLIAGAYPYLRRLLKEGPS